MTMPTMQLSAADRTRLEHFLLDFDQNWSEQHLGIMVGQLTSESQEYRVVALTELVKIELDHLQQRGDAVEIDPYLERFPKLKESDHLVADLLQAEIELRNDAGDLPSAAELTKRFPALQARIESMLAEAASNLEASRVRRAKRQHLKEETQPSRSTTSLATAAQETLPPGPRKPSGPALSDGFEGDQFGRYRLLRELGRGAMGTVFLAEDTELRRQVAIKRPRLAGTEEASMMERFYREAYAAATLDHPNICPVYDIGTHEGIPFITMAYVDGKPLSKVIRESERLNPRAVASLVRKIAVALAEAHAKGVIHRDLKPGNIMLNHRNEPIVMDFGLARQVEHADDRLTADGTLIGTPGYMSPEQVEGDLNAVGCPSDIYSLGVVLFELLTGELPFRGSVTSVIGQILRDDAPTPSSLRAKLPKELDDICMKMMAKAPADRFADMSEVSRALAAFIKSSGDSATVASPPQIEELTVARLEAQKNEITQQIAGGHWREASLQLQRMCELTEPIATPYVRWATEQSTALHARWQQEQQASVQSISTAKEQFATQDYVAAAQTLLTIDKQLLTTEGKQLLAESLKLQEEVDLLIHLIEQGLSTGKQPGMVKNLQRLMSLKSKDPLARDLYRKYRWQQRLGWFGATMADAFSFATPSRMRSWNDEPMLRKWFALGALVFCISFGLMSWAVIIYLRGPSQTLAVEVADELVASGGITLAIDGDDHVITGRDFELKVSLGSHDFTVRQGDTVIHNPESFTIEKGGEQLLRITSTDMALGPIGDVRWGATQPRVDPNIGESLNNSLAVSEQGPRDATQPHALSFGGKKTPGRVEIPSLIFDGTTPLTIEAWMKPATEADGANMAISASTHYKADDGNGIHMGYMAGSGQWYVSCPNRDEWEPAIQSADNANSIMWTHVAATLEGRMVRIFVDGKLAGQRSLSHDFVPSEDCVHLGSVPHPETGWTNYYFKYYGLIDEVRLCNTVRYRDEFTPFRRFSPDNDTLALFHCDEGTGDKLIDSSGNGHHGTIVEAKWEKLSPDAPTFVEPEMVDEKAPATVDRNVPATDSASATPLPDGPAGLVKEFLGHTKPIVGVAFSPDGKTVASASHDGTVRIWDVESGETRLQIDSPSAQSVLGMDFTPDRRHLVVGKAFTNSLKALMFDVTTGDVARRFVDSDEMVLSIDVSPGGERVAAFSRDCMVRVWDTDSGELLCSFEAGDEVNESNTAAVGFVADDKLVVSSSDADYGTRLVEVPSQREIILYGRTVPRTRQIAVTRDGATFAIADWSAAQLFDVASGEALRRIDTENRSADVEFLADGRFLAIAGVTELEIRKATDGSLLHSFEASKRSIQELAVSADGRFAITGGGGTWNPTKKNFTGDGNYGLCLWRLPKSVSP